LGRFNHIAKAYVGTLIKDHDRLRPALLTIKKEKSKPFYLAIQDMANKSATQLAPDSGTGKGRQNIP